MKQSRFKSNFIWVVFVAILYAMFAQVSYLTTTILGHIAPIFPSAGIAIAAVLILGRPAMLGVWFGSFAGNIVSYYLFPSHPQPVLTGLVIASVIALGAMGSAGVGAFLVRRLCKGQHPLHNVRNIFILITVGVLGGCIISPTIGVLDLFLFGIVPLKNIEYSWLTWWLGDAAGAIIIAPLILAIFQKNSFRFSLSQTLEALVLGSIALVLSYFVFFRKVPLEYGLIPVLLYAAFRFGMLGASTAAAVISILATIGTANGTSPFVRDTVNESLLLLHAFMAVSVISTLFLSGVLIERNRAEKELEQHRNHLESLVKMRTDELAAANDELKVTNEELYCQKEALQVTLNKLNETQNQLIQAEKMASLGILTAGIAHEINNPLNFIQGGIEGISDYYNKSIPEHQNHVSQYISFIKEGLTRVAEIVKSLSYYGRQKDLQPTECDIHSIINSCLLILQNRLKNKVDVIKNYTSKQFLFKANAGELHQSFINILMNSEQSINMKGTIEITTDLENDKLVIIIKDSGSGISKENLGKIFDPFFTTKDPGKGTGLGLSTTYKIIKEHKGTIEYKSELGKGTNVIIKLPVLI